MSLPLISAGIVNYRCSRECARAVRSLLDQTASPKEIVIVDNASGDDSVDYLRREFGGVVQIIANKRNVGFGAAQNQAIRSTSGDYYLALNPDAILQPDYVEILVRKLEENPRSGYATGLIYFCEEDMTPTPFVFTAGHWWLRGRTAVNRYYLRDFPAEEMVSGEVGGASGCAPLYCRAMLESIDLGGGEFFDETYFLYIEDVDLDWRAHLAGWSCWFEKSATGHHVGEVTGGARRGDLYAQLLTNRWLMILKNDRFGMFLRDLPYVLKSDLQHFWPTLFRYGGTRHLLSGLGKRFGEALRKRRRINRAASREELRRWLDLSLKEIRNFNDWEKSHPLRTYERMAPR